jgi:23S rRNA (guanine745-N1)-methyltransferase
MSATPARGAAERVRGLLRCPHCQGRLAPMERTWRCPRGHSFDVARQGYVNLLGGRSPHRGDSAEMLDARTAVLAAGHLDVVTAAVVAACRDLPDGALVEVGAGTAHHLAAVRRALGTRPAIAMDASVAAAKRAARADPDWTTAVVADAWGRWPLEDRSAAAILGIFAPRNGAESARVLVPGGRLVIVVPSADHLGELAAPLGLLGIDPRKDDRLATEAVEHLDLVDATEVRGTREVDRPTAVALALMGPAGHRRGRGELAERAAALPEAVEVTVAVRVLRFTPRS